MKKLILAAFATSILAVSGTAIAKAPDGTFVFKDNQSYDQRCPVGADSSQIIQNGQFVSSQQTQYPGERADMIQALLLICHANGQNK